MGMRCLAVLALVTLAPAVAVADMHPLDCLGGYSFSRGELAAKGDPSTDDKTVRRGRLNCTTIFAGETKASLASAAPAPEYSDWAVFPAAVVTVGSSRSSESLFGAIVYLRKWKFVQPLVRVLPFGFTSTRDESLQWASLAGLSLDFRCPCPKREGMVKKICQYVRPGARFDADGMTLWEKPRDSYVRFAANVGLRLELGDHHH